jgi:hypothetical protein
VLQWEDRLAHLIRALNREPQSTRNAEPGTIPSHTARHLALEHSRVFALDISSKTIDEAVRQCRYAGWREGDPIEIATFVKHLMRLHQATLIHEETLA